MNNLNTIAYIIGALLLYFSIWLLYRPIRFCFRILAHITLGICGLFCANFLLGWLGLSIGVNIVTATISGILGIPGLALLFATSCIL